MGRMGAKSSAVATLRRTLGHWMGRSALSLVAFAAGCGAVDGPEVPARRCNGHAELCERTLAEVALAGAHNAMSNGDEGWDLPNHNFGLARQLNDGVHAFLLDTYAFDDPAQPNVKAWLCHGYCKLGRKPLAEALALFDGFLDANPNEVMVMLIEDHLPTAELAALFESTGLLEHVFMGDPAGGWPTLGEMIDSGGRLLVTAEGHGPPPAWHHRFWDLGWDTPYRFNGLDALAAASGSEDSCRHNRGSTSSDLFLLNHWVGNALGLPDQKAAVTANSHAFLLARAERCRAKWKHIPNIVAVDFHDVGDLGAVINELNGLAAP